MYKNIQIYIYICVVATTGRYKHACAWTGRQHSIHPDWGPEPETKDPQPHTLNRES